MNRTMTRKIADQITFPAKQRPGTIGAQLCRAALAFLLCVLPFTASASEPPKLGDKAPDFTLKTLDDQTVHLGELTK